MKTFVVTFRNGNGKRDALEVSAEDRTDLFARLRKRGIAAISIAEGGTGGKRSGPKVALALGVGLVALLAGAVACIFLSVKGHGPDGDGNAERGRIRDAYSGTARPRKKEPAAAERRRAIRTRSVKEALDNVGELELPEIVPSDVPVDVDRYTNRYFKTGVEQVMGWVFTCRLGDMPPPLPTFTDEDRANIVSILLSRNEIKDGDDDAAVDAKQSVEHAKKEMLRFLREGGDPQEFMEYYHGELRKANDYRCLVVEQAEAVHEEDPELCREFIDKVNERLDDMGIRRISTADFE